MRVGHESRVNLLQFSLQGYRDCIAAVAHASEAENSREEVLLKEVWLVERQAVGRAKQGDERAVRVHRADGVDERRCRHFGSLGHIFGHPMSMLSALKKKKQQRAAALA